MATRATNRPGALRAEGYNTLTWDPRGIGGSGGIVNFDSPDFEARDVQALIDFVATAPEALLDGPNDPRVGMSGSSYGGGIQLATAAIDARARRDRPRRHVVLARRRASSPTAR